MRIGVVGAAGRVGSRLVETILSSPGLELAACIVRPRSRHVGQPVAGGGIEYRAADSAINARCDVMIDFSTPASTMTLQELCAGKRIPFVIGTSGLTARQAGALRAHARHRPIVTSDNFAAGSHGFETAAAMISRSLPGAMTKRAEHRRLRRERGFERPVLPTAADITEYHFDAGGVEVTLTYRVNTLAAYAHGALAAAHWLAGRNAAPGLYTLADISRHSSGIKDDRS